MEKIFEEMWDWLVSDVAAHHNVPGIFLNILFQIKKLNNDIFISLMEAGKKSGFMDFSYHFNAKKYIFLIVRPFYTFLLKKNSLMTKELNNSNT